MKKLTAIFFLIILFSCENEQKENKILLSELAIMERLNTNDSLPGYYTPFYNATLNPQQATLYKLIEFEKRIKALFSRGKLKYQDTVLRSFQNFTSKIEKNEKIIQSIDSLFSSEQTNEMVSLSFIEKFYDLNILLRHKFILENKLKCYQEKDIAALSVSFAQDSADTHQFRINMPGFSSCLLNDINTDTVYINKKLQKGILKFNPDYSLYNVQLFNLQKGDYELNGIFYYDLGFKYKELPFSYTFSKK